MWPTVNLDRRLWNVANILGRNVRRTQTWGRSQDPQNNLAGPNQGHGARSEFKDLQGGYKPDDGKVDSIPNIDWVGGPDGKRVIFGKVAWRWIIMPGACGNRPVYLTAGIYIDVGERR